MIIFNVFKANLEEIELLDFCIWAIEHGPHTNIKGFENGQYFGSNSRRIIKSPFSDVNIDDFETCHYSGSKYAELENDQ